MADTTKIEWTRGDDGKSGATWNPLAGCTAVSPGCDHCYAAREASGRLAHLPLYAGLASGGVFTGEVRLAPERLDQPLRWRRPRRVFVNSMSDLFHDAVPDEYIDRVFDVMEKATRHTFQVLTKRHARMRSYVARRQQKWVDYAASFADCPTEEMRNSPAAQWARNRATALPGHIWLGVSVEDQRWADIRIPALLDTPAAVRWLSCEPLLGPVDLADYLGRDGCPTCEGSGSVPAPGGGAQCPTCEYDRRHAMTGVDWVVVGGESGPKARLMHPDWVRSLRDQCTAAGVPFFMKQAGEALAREWKCSDRKGHNPAEWPEPFPREYPSAA